MVDLRGELESHLQDWQAGWSVGSFGAIAEFHQDADEAALVEAPLTRATARGAIRIERLDGVVPVAWEALSKNPARWQQGVALCLPVDEARASGRRVLTECGPDAGAIRPEDRTAILFDMGLAQANIDFCIRTDDPALLACLRAEAGRSLLEPGNPAMGAILKAHPHRVSLSAIGRCEVYQKIGGSDTGGVSPAGPHTHVLPKLMAAGRSHSANTPIPEALMPGMMLHPANPTMGTLGEDRAFDDALFARFQRLLEAWGAPEYVAAKGRVWAAMDADRLPEACPETDQASSRVERTALRNAIRQRARGHGVSALVAAWSAALDRGAITADEDMPGH
ncbi:MAG: hypothetical protein AAGI34_10785 [Pseudomonadota bacterium]